MNILWFSFPGVIVLRFNLTGGGGVTVFGWSYSGDNFPGDDCLGGNYPDMIHITPSHPCIPHFDIPTCLHTHTFTRNTFTPHYPQIFTSHILNRYSLTSHPYTLKRPNLTPLTLDIFISFYFIATRIAWLSQRLFFCKSVQFCEALCILSIVCCIREMSSPGCILQKLQQTSVHVQ